jgi:hypothetical protein
MCRGTTEAVEGGEPGGEAAGEGAGEAKPVRRTCSECGVEFEGRPNRVVCSPRCRDRRYRRLHPDKVREKEKRKAARRAPTPEGDFLTAG